MIDSGILDKIEIYVNRIPLNTINPEKFTGINILNEICDKNIDKVNVDSISIYFEPDFDFESEYVEIFYKMFYDYLLSCSNLTYIGLYNHSNFSYSFEKLVLKIIEICIKMPIKIICISMFDSDIYEYDSIKLGISKANFCNLLVTICRFYPERDLLIQIAYDDEDFDYPSINTLNSRLDAAKLGHPTLLSLLSTVYL